MNSDAPKREAGRAKYIFVWILAAAITNALTTKPDWFAEVAFNYLFSSMGTHYAYAVIMGTVATLSVVVTLLVYALFRDIYIQRVVPYFWLSGAITFIILAGSWFGNIGINYERSGFLYIDLFVQFVRVLMLYWLPSTFWPRKYYPPQFGYTDSFKPERRPRITEKRPTDAQRYERREPTLSKAAFAETSSPQNHSTNTVVSQDEFPISPTKTDNSSQSYNAEKPITLWLPFAAYFTSFILIFLKGIKYNIIGFVELARSPNDGRMLEVLIMEKVFGPALQPTILFIFVSVIIWGISLLGIGKNKNTRRWVHVAFATLFIVAVLNPYS